MRRFIYQDDQYEVKVTVDIPENLFQGIRQGKNTIKETIKKLVIYTLDKEEAHEQK